jgi:hypothetical protein
MTQPPEKRFPLSTKHFVWIHTPKTGGTWLYPILTGMAPPSWLLRRYPPVHVQADRVEPQLKKIGLGARAKLPWIAGIRNPWDWYVSVYFFMEQHYVNRTGGFAGPWNSAQKAWAERYSKGNNVEGFRRALPELLEVIHGQDKGFIRPQHEFVSLNGELAVRPIRFERLREEVIEALEETGAEVTQQMRNQIMRRPPMNMSGHAAYTDLYTRRLMVLVRQYEEWMVETFKYRFG